MPIYGPIVRAISASDATSQGTVRITGSNAVTVKTDASGAVIDAPVQTVQTQSITAQPGVRHIVASDATFSTGTVSITGVGGGATVNTAASKIQVSVAAPVAQSVQPGVQHLIASNNTFSSGTVTVTGAGNITVTTGASMVSISGSQSAETGQLRSVSVSANASTSGALANVSSGALSLVAGPNITLSQNANTIAISAREMSANFSQIPGPANYYTNASSAVGATAFYQPMLLENHLSVESIAVQILPFASTSAQTGSIRMDVAIYTKNASSISSLATSSYTTSWSSGTNNVTNWGGYSGNRRYNIPFSSSLTPGHYWVGWQLVSVGANLAALAVGSVGLGAMRPAGLSAASTGGYPFGLGAATRVISNLSSHAASDITIATTNPWVPAMYLFNTNAQY